MSSASASFVSGGVHTVIHTLKSANFIADFGEISEITSFNVQIINNAAYFMNFFISDDGINWTMVTEGLSGTGLSRITLTQAYHPANALAHVNYATWRLAGGANTNILIASGAPIHARYFMIAGYGRANNAHDATAPNVVWYDFRNLSFFGPFEANPVTGVTLNMNATTLVAASTETLTATITPVDAMTTGVTWASSNPAVAVVNNAGVVTALTPGTATITVTTEDGGHTAECIVTVTPFVGPVATRLVFYNEISNNTETANSLAPAEGDLALGATDTAGDGLPTAAWGAAQNAGVNGTQAFRAGTAWWQKAPGAASPHNPANSWLALDFAGVTGRGEAEGTVTFNEIVLISRNAPFFHNYVIEISDNGTDWTLIYVSTQPVSTGNGRGSKIAFAETITTSHIRLRALTSSDDRDSLQLMRFALYNVPTLPRIVEFTPNPVIVQQGSTVEITVVTENMPAGAWVDLNVAWRAGLSIVGGLDGCFASCSPMHPGPRFYIGEDGTVVITIAATANAPLGQDGFGLAARVADQWGAPVIVDDAIFVIIVEPAPVPRIVEVTPSPVTVQRGGTVEITVVTEHMPAGAWVDLNVAWRAGLSIVGGLDGCFASCSPMHPGPRFYIGEDGTAVVTIAVAANAPLGQDGFGLAARVADQWGAPVIVDDAMLVIIVG